MAEDSHELRNIIEAALLACPSPLSVSKLVALFPDEARPAREEVHAALAELEAACAERGVELCRVGNGYRFQTKQRYAPWLRKLSETRPPRYSRALLETLAIIAYRQPVTRGDIEEIRGVAVSTETMRTLLDREWVRQVGYRDVPGRPALYATTRQFLEYFNLGGLKELPTLIEKRTPNEIATELNLSLPLDAEIDTESGEVAEADDAVARSTAREVDAETEASLRAEANRSPPLGD